MSGGCNVDDRRGPVAARVCAFFRGYLELGRVNELLRDLRERNIPIFPRTVNCTSQQ